MPSTRDEFLAVIASEDTRSYGMRAIHFEVPLWVTQPIDRKLVVASLGGPPVSSRIIKPTWPGIFGRCRTHARTIDASGQGFCQDLAKTRPGGGFLLPRQLISSRIRRLQHTGHMD